VVFEIRRTIKVPSSSTMYAVALSTLRTPIRLSVARALIRLPMSRRPSWRSMTIVHATLANFGSPSG